MKQGRKQGIDTLILSVNLEGFTFTADDDKIDSELIMYW